MKILVAGAAEYWYSCCEYCYCNGPSARGSGQESAEKSSYSLVEQIFSMAMFQYLKLTYRFTEDIDAIILLGSDGQGTYWRQSNGLRRCT